MYIMVYLQVLYQNQSRVFQQSFHNLYICLLLTIKVYKVYIRKKLSCKQTFVCINYDWTSYV